MNLDILRKSGNIIFECISGSHAYGLNTPTSDKDIRGVFCLPIKDRISIFPKLQEIGDEKQDIKFFELEKFFKLAMECNPNIIELFFTPPDCIVYQDDIWTKIINNRNIFISKRAFYTHGGYAFSQIKKAKGENKWVHNPKPEAPPKKEDFCWIIPVFFKDTWQHRISVMPFELAEKLTKMPPCRPIPLNEFNIDLKDFQIAALEHVPNTFRLYNYSDGSKGVFRGSDEQLTCDNIPLEDEDKRFAGLLVFNKHEYEKASVDWRNYWSWVKNRNPHRWKKQEDGILDFDQKNMMHCMRLLLSVENILKFGEPRV